MSAKNNMDFPDSGFRMPALFIGHGSPMNAVEENRFTRAWADMAAAIPRPKAILCISAHWETDGTCVTAQEHPKTIHDFYGFPEKLFQMNYPAPGSPALAELVRQTARATPVRPDHSWGIDHGAWSVLCRMFPRADIPVALLSLDSTKPPAFHYELGKDLKSLREKGILIVGSGNIVHNLRTIVWKDTAYDWATAFDDRIRDLILAGDHDAVIEYHRLGPEAGKAVPTNEHFLPLLYTLALREPGESIRFPVEGITLGSISMRSVRIG